MTRTDPTDQNEISVGCGMAFLSWLQKLGYALDRIAPAMVTLGTSAVLAQLYARLTGDAEKNAKPKFLAAVNALPGGVTSDDPFGALRTRAPGAPGKRAGGKGSGGARGRRGARGSGGRKSARRGRRA